MAERLLGMAVFAKTAETGSFAAAAAQMGMSAQMAGKHVAALEQRLGARLLNRSTHTQSLTEAGRVYLTGCRRALAEAEAADASVAAQVGAPRGTLRLTAPVGFGTDHLVPRITRFLERHLEIAVELSLSDRVADFIEEGYDAAIRIGSLPDSTLVARTLAPYRVVACASPAYLERRGIPQTPEDLQRHECLDYVFPQYPAPRLWTFRTGERTIEVEPRARLVINDGRALVEAALVGFGIIRTGEMKVAEHLASGRLVRLLADYDGPRRPLQVVFASQRLQAPKLRVFIDWLVEAFADLR